MLESDWLSGISQSRDLPMTSSGEAFAEACRGECAMGVAAEACTERGQRDQRDRETRETERPEIDRQTTHTHP